MRSSPFLPPDPSPSQLDPLRSMLHILLLRVLAKS
ncbi:unnamed protein product [Nezara viridula]|uniref:Uncharacterized protein n=1 Tax=Nezara viridula TaxID=85310 RepID=A0A9P0H403_NEZVI|nr:unnamed protein product [Nezara viridula]